ncbi:MAG TPA: AAA family ATPase [Clostridiales bacterium]|nr:AAA family ATPase [Clostridiales bacterium]
MHITITGNLGSGKSTICKLLSDKYQFEIYSTGKVQRELAREMSMTTLELNQLMRSDHKYDHMIDDATARISRENPDKNIIFDSRLAWNFVESSFKVFVSVSTDVAAERVMNDNRGEEERYQSYEEARRMLVERAATESVRYKEIYKVNYMDFSNYDLVIDSTYCTPDIIAEIILDEAKEYEKNGKQAQSKMLVSPYRLLKEDDISKDDRQSLENIAKEYEKVSRITDKIIKVKKNDETFTVVEGIEYVKAAYIADVPYVSIKVID